MQQDATKSSGFYRFTPPADTCLMFLVRHGATENNLAHPPRLQGSGTDLGLSATGQSQARMVRDCLRDQPLVAIYASPLLRAVETATILAEPHGQAVQTVSALLEIDVGDWEGRSWVDIQREEPEAYQGFMTAPEIHPYAGGENITQLLARVEPALEGLANAHVGQTVAVVAHNVVNRSYVGKLLGLSMAAARGIPQHNCGINVIRYRQGVPKILSVNSIAHLENWGD